MKNLGKMETKIEDLEIKFGELEYECHDKKIVCCSVCGDHKFYDIDAWRTVKIGKTETYINWQTGGSFCHENQGAPNNVFGIYCPTGEGLFDLIYYFYKPATEKELNAIIKLCPELNSATKILAMQEIICELRPEIKDLLFDESADEEI